MNLKKAIKELLNIILVTTCSIIFIMLFIQYLDNVIRNIKTFSDWLFMLCIPMIAYSNILFKQPKNTRRKK